MSSDRPADDLLASLKIVGRIRQHERISTTGEVVRVEAQDVLQSIRRWWHGESREKNLQSIATLIDTAFQQLELRSRKQDPTPADKVFVIRLREELNASLRGLQNLQCTYERDSVSEARLDVLRDRIRMQLTQFDAAAPTTTARRTSSSDDDDDDEGAGAPSLDYNY